MRTRPNVYVPNKAGHDYSSAERFGSLVFLTEGTVKRYNTNTIYRIFCDGLAESECRDFLLVSSLPILNSIATGILAYKFGQVNYLLFHDGSYLERSVNFASLLSPQE